MRETDGVSDTSAVLAPGSVLPGVRSREPLHPGRFLERHYLKPLAMTQTEAARQKILTAAGIPPSASISV